MITRRKSKAASAASAASTSPQLAKTARVFASSSELEQKRKAEQSNVIHLEVGHTRKRDIKFASRIFNLTYYSLR